jgi:hypothetical protein
LANEPIRTYKPGDTVEVDDAGINSWEKGVIVPFWPGDVQDGSIYRIKFETGSLRNPKGEISQTIHIRPASFTPGAEAAAQAKLGPGNHLHPGTIAPPASEAASVRPVGASPNRPAGAPPVTRPNLTHTTPNHVQATPPPAAPQAPKTEAGLNPQMAGGMPSIPGTGWDLMGLQKRGEAPSTPKSFAQSFSFCKTGRWSITRYGLAAGQMGTYKVSGKHLTMINSLDNQPFGNFEMTWRAADKMLILDDGKWIWSLKLVSLNACGEH